MGEKITKKEIEDVLNKAVWAPSGDNVQPWFFKVKENNIQVYNNQLADDSIYNYKQNASFVAIGALIENVQLLFGNLGYDVNIKLFPGNNVNCVAELKINKGLGIKDNPLTKQIERRTTNRKPYSLELPEEKINSLLQLNKEINNEKLLFVTDKQKKIELAKSLSANEKIVLENKKLHEFLFRHITWNNKEDLIKKGFFVKTLEIKGSKQIIFRLIKNWYILRILNFLGLSKIISKENAEIYSKSGAFCAIISDSTNPQDYVNCGILMQKMWLKATELELYVQPVTGIVLLDQAIKATDVANNFKDEHLNLIKKSYSKIKTLLNLGSENILIIFRLGQAPEPSAKTRRKNALVQFV